MRRAALVTLCCTLAACGSAAPLESTIYYDPALRPGIVEAQGPERDFLARLDEIGAGEAVRVGDCIYVADAPYAAASGRRCRPIRVRGGSAERQRLACESEDGWVFVPEVLAGGEP